MITIRIGISSLFFQAWHIWRRKKCIINGILVLVLIFLLSYYSFEKIRPSSFESNLEFQKAQRQITQLKSLLKRYKVPEDEFNEKNLVTIYIITPTYTRPEQKAELTRLKNVFLHIQALHWILVEDSKIPTTLVSNFLKSSMLSYTHLYVPTPPEWKLNKNEQRWRKPRGLLQRNEAISWLRTNKKNANSGVVYFADDDNTYSIELFNEMRNTNLVSVWPVGLVGEVLVESPDVDSKGKVIGWHVGWKSDRTFATDMAGFAVNLVLLLKTPEASFSPISRMGFMESDFLEKLIERRDLEPKADLCTKVLVWHTQTKETKLRWEEKLKQQGHSSDARIET